MKGNLYDILKGSVLKVSRALGFEIMRYNVRSSEDVLLKTIIDQYAISTILDVGANEGQYGEKIIDGGYKGKLYSFEPIPGVFQKLKRAADKKPGQWQAINVGVGSREAEMMINVTENLASSSMFTVGKNSLEAEPATKITHQEKIRITTIDQFMSGVSLSGNIMLKLDIQGFELEALKGAVASLKHFKVVQAELSFTPVYDEAPLYKEIIAFLEQNGFELFSFIPVFIDIKTGRMLQADGIFVKST